MWFGFRGFNLINIYSSFLNVVCLNAQKKVKKPKQLNRCWYFFYLSLSFPLFLSITQIAYLCRCIDDNTFCGAADGDAKINLIIPVETVVKHVFNFSFSMFFFSIIIKVIILKTLDVSDI